MKYVIQETREWYGPKTTRSLVADMRGDPLIAAGYMIQDRNGYAIQAIGSTAEEAWRELVANAGPFFDAEGNEKDDELAREEDFRTFGATAALIQKVEEEGGLICWDVINGVACTIEESEALQGD